MEEQEFEQEQDLGLDRFTDRQESNPLFVAVNENDLDRLKSLIQSGHSVNSKNIRGETLLNQIIMYNRVAMFDYIFALEELQIDHHIVDIFALNNEYFALQLIDKGANIHERDRGGLTILHLLAMFSGDKLKLAQLVIEKGLDVNVQDRFGATPLYLACEMFQKGNFDLICMLLYYGALATIPSDKGILPLAVIRPAHELPISKDDHAHLLETLFNLTFDSDRITVRLPILVAAMKNGCPLFPKLLEMISDVDYDYDHDLVELYTSLIHFKTEHFKLFANKFGNVIQDLVESFPTLEMLTDCSHLEIYGVKGLILTLLESNCVEEFVQNTIPSYPTIGKFIEIWKYIPDMNVEEVTKIACLMLSYGLSVNFEDLNMVYFRYGYCELFKILLHMDIEMEGYGRGQGVCMAELYYEPTTSIEIFFNKTLLSLDLLSYYNRSRLKELCLSHTVDEEIAAKAKSLPTVPSLLELSRDMARKFIIQRYKVQNSMQFYTILRWFPINEIYKKIIGLEKKLY